MSEETIQLNVSESEMKIIRDYQRVAGAYSLKATVLNAISVAMDAEDNKCVDCKHYECSMSDPPCSQCGIGNSLFEPKVRDKVMTGLKCCTGAKAPIKCGECPYAGNDDYNDLWSCRIALMRDSKELLKKQKQRIGELEEKLRVLEYGDQDTLSYAT